MEARRAFLHIAIIFFVSLLFHNMQLFSVYADTVIDILVLLMSHYVAYIKCAATVKQPTLTNSRSAEISRMDMYAG